MYDFFYVYINIRSNTKINYLIKYKNNKYKDGQIFLLCFK